MKASQQTCIHIALALIAVLALVAWAYFLYRSGCIADLKGGTWGDPNSALDFEARGIAFGVLACTAVALIVGTYRRVSLVERIGWIFVSWVFGFFFLVVVGISIEFHGITSCKPSDHAIG